jgi:hypothetical protein
MPFLSYRISSAIQKVFKRLDSPTRSGNDKQTNRVYGQILCTIIESCITGMGYKSFFLEVRIERARMAKCTAS